MANGLTPAQVAERRRMAEEFVSRAPELSGFDFERRITDPSITNFQAELGLIGRSESPTFAKSFGLASDIAGREARGQTREEAIGALGVTPEEAVALPFGDVEVAREAGQFTSGPLAPKTATLDAEGNIVLANGQRISPQDFSYNDIAAQVGLPQTGARRPDPTIDEGIISSDSITTTPEIDFETVASTPLTDISGLGVELTPTQQQAQDISETAQQATEDLIGESAFRTQKEEEFGLPELTATQRDLQAQLQQLKFQAAAIRPSLEEGAVGLGITTELLGRRERSLLNQTAIKALSVATLLEASRGNIATATDLVDRAVAAKYDPIRERLNASLTNLEIVKESPQFSAEEKAQADNMEIIMEAKKAAIEAQAEEEKAVKNVAIEAARNGADSVLLNKISNAETELEATRLASGFLGGGAERTQIRSVGGRELLIDLDTGNVVKDLGPSKVSGAGGVSFSSAQSQLEASKGDDGYVNTDVYKRLRSQASNRSEFDDNFSHMLNPNDPSAKEILAGTAAGKNSGGLNFDEL